MMKYSRNLMTGLIGLALLAAPITAAAQNSDTRKDNSRQSQAQPQAQSRQNTSASHSYSAPARSNPSTREAAPRTATRNESRDERASTRNPESASMTRNAAPAAATRNESRDQRSARSDNSATGVTPERSGNRNEANRSYSSRDHEGSGDYRNYGDRGYDHDRDYAGESSYYVMPRGYAGGACAWARHLRIVYAQDRNSGHPAAAADLLPQLRNAERRCGGVPYGYNSYRYRY